jgi:DNA-binding NtrC family response regulator
MEMEPRSLLIVEDDGVIRQTLAALLRDEGFSVVAVSELRAALLIVRRHAVSAAVLDWRLEHETAEPVLELLARERLPVATVLVSAAPEARDVADRYQIPFVAKPLDLDAFAETVETAIREQRTPRVL